MLSGFFQWWYSDGFIQAWRFTAYSIERISDFFSLPILIRTWFSPWKNDQLSAHNLALSDQLKVWALNLAGRFIGFLVRSVIIVIALIVITFISLLVHVS